MPHVRNGKVLLLGNRVAIVPCPEDCCGICGPLPKPDRFRVPAGNTVPFSTQATGNDVQGLCKNNPNATAVEFQCNAVYREQKQVINPATGRFEGVPNNFPYCCYLSNTITSGSISFGNFREAVLSGRAQSTAELTLEYGRADGVEELVVMRATVDITRSDFPANRDPNQPTYPPSGPTRYTAISGSHVFEKYAAGQLTASDTLDIYYAYPNRTAADTLALGNTIWPEGPTIGIAGLNNNVRLPADIESRYYKAYLSYFFRKLQSGAPAGSRRFPSAALGPTQYTNFRRNESFLNFGPPLLTQQSPILAYEETSNWDCTSGQTCRRWSNVNYLSSLGQVSLKRGSVTQYWTIQRSGCSGPPGGSLPA
jgi:hypothetical protein